MPIEVQQTIPILRIFDEAKAREFYIDFLGFAVDWEHRFEPGMPLYMQASRAGLTLHLEARGTDDHHVVEAAFKALARALRSAVERDPRRSGIASTKGVL